MIHKSLQTICRWYIRYIHCLPPRTGFLRPFPCKASLRILTSFPPDSRENWVCLWKDKSIRVTVLAPDLCCSQISPIVYYKGSLGYYHQIPAVTVKTGTHSSYILFLWKGKHQETSIVEIQKLWMTEKYLPTCEKCPYPLTASSHEDHNFWSKIWQITDLAIGLSVTSRYLAWSLSHLIGKCDFMKFSTEK